MDALEASTVIHVPREEVYEFIQDFSGYTDYSEHLDRVEQYGDGGPGTDYRITVSWWKLSYTSATRVTDVDRPERIEWRSVGDVRARGWWHIEPADVDADPASRLRLRVEFDPESVRGGSVTRLLPVERLVERVRPVVLRESEKVVEAMVADLEGERRPVELTVHRGPRTL